MKKLCCICTLLLLLTACGQEKSPADASGSEPPAASTQGQVASSSQMAPAEDVVDPDMVPIYGDSLKVLTQSQWTPAHPCSELRAVS